MAVRIAINGFGRIGRLVLRVAMQNKDIEVVGINDLLEPNYMAYMLKYDSTHHKYKGNIEINGNELIVDNKKILLCKEMKPENLPWAKLNVDYVVESTGFFTTLESAEKHIAAGAKRVVISAPSADAPMFVMGVNQDKYKGEKIISNASCTTNCLSTTCKNFTRKLDYRRRTNDYCACHHRNSKNSGWTFT